MSRRRIVNFAAICLTWASIAASTERPNIVLILADDMGWMDMACYGADLHETPHLDRLAGESVRFTSAYAMPVCSPTRAALLTGRHAARVRMTIWSEGTLQGPQNRRLLQAHSLHSLPNSEKTLAEHLQGKGYLTALVGKWHLGDADHYPETHGFDVNIGGTRWGAPTTFWWPYNGSGRFGPEFRYVPHLEFGTEGEYLTDRLTDEALKVIDHAGEDPFFLFLSHHVPHTPIEAKASDVAHFRKKLRPELHHQNPHYAGMIKSLDESVGRVLDRLRQRGLEEKTIVIFASDNGGYIGIDRKSGQDVSVTNNAPLRSGKGSCYEGGIRVPLLIRWPGVTARGVSCDCPVVVMDLFPTILQAAGTPLNGNLPLDGIDLTPLLKDPDARLKRDSLFFHYPHYYPTTTPVSAVRSGEWKLLEYYEDQRVELFNLQSDLSESKNLAEIRPDITADLRRQLHRWLAEVEAELPKSNPDFKGSSRANANH